MKTDAELNRLVAERVMGWKYEKSDPLFGRHWIKPDGTRSTLPAYCTDPAAWGALFVWLAEQNKMPTIEHCVEESDDEDEPEHTTYFSSVYDGSDYRPGWDVVSPGRALVLATLAAYGVEEVE